MAAKKENTKGKKASSKKTPADKLREEHPFETDSQIQNRYGEGREKSGSDGTHQDGRGSNH
ncbi:MAG: hypothetical protein JWR72_2348 [Flavisolibacter sp.]|jgi:hypothetical protein|nr:hypothetical protein [Flavisolibacter sp.]